MNLATLCALSVLGLIALGSWVMQKFYAQALQVASHAHAEQMFRVELRHRDELSELQAEHQEVMSRLQAKHCEAVAKLKTDRDEAVYELRVQHEKIVASLQEKYTADLGALKLSQATKRRFTLRGALHRDAAIIETIRTHRATAQNGS